MTTRREPDTLAVWGPAPRVTLGTDTFLMYVVHAEPGLGMCGRTLRYRTLARAYDIADSLDAARRLTAPAVT